MKKINHIFSMLIMISFLILHIGSSDDMIDSAIESGIDDLTPYDSGSSDYYDDDDDDDDYYYDEPSYNSCACQDLYGNCYSYSNTCYTCGTTYCNDYNSLDYGKYCSQNCCAAYEGLSTKCGYYY